MIVIWTVVLYYCERRVGDIPFLGLGLGLVTSHFWVGFLGFAKTNTY